VERIVKELHSLISRYHVDGFVFADDELTTNKRFISELCDSFMSTGLARHVKWSCQARADRINNELIRKLKEAGCVLVRFGLESGSEKMLRFLKRGTVTVEHNRRAVRICREEGMPCYSAFLIGSPDETVDDIVQTIEFMVQCRLDYADIYIVVPYPGTALYDLCRERGLLRNHLKWSDFVIDDKEALPILRSHHFSPQQLMDIRRYIDMNVVTPLNRGREPEKLDHKREIEKILAGDRLLVSGGIGAQVAERLTALYNTVTYGLAHPYRAVRYINRARLRWGNRRI
jgi:radical SAM superfamily enzyme YgiQ (UPF0313 family)